MTELGAWLLKPSHVALPIAMCCLILASCAEDPKAVSPDTIELNDRGVSKMGQFQYAAAHKDFTEVVAQSPTWEVGLVNLAIATLNRQNPDDELRTLEILQSVLEINPANTRALYTSGIVNLYLGQTAEAIEFLEQVVVLDPNDAFAAYFLGQAHLQDGSYKDAQTWLLKTLELNDAIRSAYWAAATASRRLGDLERTTSLIEQYQAFEHNPLSVSAGFSYKQMGPKAEAKSVIANITSRSKKPPGPLFAEPTKFDTSEKAFSSISSFDMNQDGQWDLLLSNGTHTVTAIGSKKGFTVSETTNSIDAHSASAWGDMNNNGSTELLTCADDGMTMSMLSGLTIQSKETIDSTSCQSLRVIDVDHDGDLDIVGVRNDGLKIYHNNLAGKFIPFLELEHPTWSEPAVQQVFAEDLNRDRDVDLVILGRNANNLVLQNELTWRYTDYPALAGLHDEDVVAITGFDGDLDGRIELYAAQSDGNFYRWVYGEPAWIKTPLDLHVSDVIALDAQDFDGDGRTDLFIAHLQGFMVTDPSSSTILAQVELDNLIAATPVYTSASTGPGVVAATKSDTYFYPPGPGRYNFLAIALSGKTSADQMRSNASGIGTYIKLRADTRWSLASNFSQHSGVSQSLMPLSFGSGGASSADYIELLWSDGVSQTEIALNFGELHRIEEIQRQLASCPVVFAWNGKKYEFVSDVLGVAALGYFSEPDATTPVRPYERLLLPEGFLQPRQDKFEIKIGEPMEEVLYLDSAGLLYFDIPEIWSMALDERLHVQSPQPTGEPIYFEEVHTPHQAYTQLDADVTNELSELDRIAVDPGPVDQRFIGLVAEEYTLTMEFSEILPRTNAVLVAEGWVEFPYSQTSFAAYQAATPYKAPTLEAQDGNGNWHLVAEQFGFPAGMPRQMALRLPELPEGVKALRLRTNLELYWDRIRIVREATPADLNEGRTALSRAIVRAPGFARRTTGPQRTPYYDYDNRLPYWDAKFATGFYTTMGDAKALVEETDSTVAIIGSGEEIHLEFEVPPAPKPGFRRYYALDFRGWAKDMDLYTQTGDRVEPIPALSDVDAAQLQRRHALHSKHNLRFQDGLPTPQ